MPKINATSTLSEFSPLAYDSAYEVPVESEALARENLMTTLRSFSVETLKNSSDAALSLHAKSHGLLLGEINVLDGLPDYLAQGLFAKLATLPIVMRFSNILGDAADEHASAPRGLAIKVVGVEGARLIGTENAVTQDFVLVNVPAFSTAGPHQFFSKLDLLATTTNRVPDLKKALSTILQCTEKLMESVAIESANIKPTGKSTGANPGTHVLSETYFSQAPILYGDYMAKISVAPVSHSLVQLKNALIDLKHKPNGLREAVVNFFADNTAEWELRVQLCTDLESMPIEDASVIWSEEMSPYIAVARITVKPQLAWSEARSKMIDDGMTFSPWHGIDAHRPIGSIMRVRKMAYEMSAKFRAEHNRTSMVEPTGLQDFPN